jgi:DNA ligase (NAD+)
MVFLKIWWKNIDLYDISKKYLDKNIEEYKKSDISKLQKALNMHSDLYYNKEEPIISDYEYDELFKKLETLESKFWIDWKQTLLVWADVLESTFLKVKHSRPMISLDNTYNEEDLSDFNERVLKNIDDESITNLTYALEFKFDWLGVELIYKAWELVQAITRGNWVEWEDVTVNVMQVKNIPKKIKYKKHLEVRGEVVMPISVFEWLNEKAKREWTKIFSNPRNAASWSLRMKDANITKQRNLKFFAYDLANFEEFRLDEKISEYFDVIKHLENLGFDISSYFEKFNWIEEVKKAIENFPNIKNTIDFEIDWLVLKVNDVTLWKDIWFTEHHPKYAIAYKFPAEILTTKILSVEHSVWRTGTITPVANLEAINIWWVVVRRATLHNYEEVENLDARIWDSVFIKRAGEVIPKIISVIKTWNRDELETILPPKFCPSCGTEILKDEWKVRYYCPNNIDCPAKNSEKLAFAVWKQWFNIDWLWERQVELFLELWIIHNLVDVFKIQEKAEIILELEWFQEKSVNNLIAGVEKAKNIEIATFLTALWIPWVGKKTAKTLSKLITSPLAPLLRGEVNVEELEQLPDIWPEIANNVIEYFNNEAHKKILGELIEILNIKYYKNTNTDSKSIFAWKKVCITWSFELDWVKISRDDLVKKLEEVWWDFVWTISKNTDYLLAGANAWSKLAKAEKEGVRVVDLEFFLENL